MHPTASCILVSVVSLSLASTAHESPSGALGRRKTSGSRSVTSCWASLQYFSSTVVLHRSGTVPWLDLAPLARRNEWRLLDPWGCVLPYVKPEWVISSPLPAWFWPIFMQPMPSLLAFQPSIPIVSYRSGWLSPICQCVSRARKAEQCWALMHYLYWEAKKPEYLHACMLGLCRAWQFHCPP